MAINTIEATIQMRRGEEDKFDPDQMTAGEWAVSTNSKKVWMCFAPGIVRRMATYEAFEQDMKEIQLILATCQDIQEAVERFKQLAEQHASQAEEWSVTSKSWAIGGTGTREGEDTDNSKYYSEQSKNEADRAKNEADRAAAIAGIDIDSELSETSANPVQNKVIAKVLAKLKEVAFSGSYTDLSNKPTIPTNMTGATASAAGETGLVPAPGAGKQNAYLRGDGTWVTPATTLAGTVEGIPLDQTMGKVLDDKISAINSNLMEISSAQELVNNYIRAFYSKKGQTVSLYIEQNKTNLSYDTACNLGTLPIGYRPLRSFANMVALGRNTPIMAYLSVGSGGDVTLRPYGDLPVGGYTYCYITFVCK